MLIGLAIGCNKDVIIEQPEQPKTEVLQPEYLTFESDAEFQSLLKQYIDEENGVSTKSVTTKTARGFVSISQLEKQKSATKSGIDDEEMTEDEYNVMKAKLLLPDPVLHNLLDTTLRIAVGDDFYKITEYGTFITKKAYEGELNALLENFESIKDQYKMTEKDSIISVTKNIQLGNTFRYTPVEDNLVYEDQENSDLTIPQTRSTQNEYISKYNLRTHKWEGRTWFSNNVWSIFGKDYSREHYFDSKHRVKLVLFNVNYFFYQSSGVKVEMERQKKAWFVKWWVDDATENMALGFGEFTGTITYHDFVANPHNDKTAVDAYNVFNGYINGQFRKMLYKGYSEMPFIKDWASDILSFVPELNLNVVGQNLSLDALIKSQAKDFVDKPEFVFQWLESLTNKTVMYPIKQKVLKDTPKSVYTLYGPKTVKTFITGVKEYGRMSRKVMRFHRSFGLRITYGTGEWGIEPFFVSKHAMDKIDVFGAAYYRGEWRGVRFIN